MKKIFQIGFNKSGTGSIHKFMLKNDIPSVHWDGGRLSKKICENHDRGLPLLEGYNEYASFTDMEHLKDGGGFFYSGEFFFKKLASQYPESCFILNYRNAESWIKSRINHDGYLLRCLREVGDKNKVISMWEEEYYSHIHNVRTFFSGSNKLLELNLDEASGFELGDFLEGHGFSIKSKSLPHVHRTKKFNKSKHVDAIRDAAVFFEESNIEVSIKLMECAAELRPNGKKINDRLKWYKEVTDRS